MEGLPRTRLITLYAQVTKHTRKKCGGKIEKEFIDFIDKIAKFLHIRNLLTVMEPEGG